MSTSNLRLGWTAYNDTAPGNNPYIKIFDLTYNLLGVTSAKPLAENRVIPPGATETIFDGTRITSVDGTTAFDVTKPYLALNTYRFMRTAGTQPQFRTNRAIAVDNTTEFTVTVNGPIATLTNSAGTAPNLASVVVGDVLRVDLSAGFSANNQGTFVIIAKTSNSLTVKNISAVGEVVTLTNTTTNSFLVYSNGALGNQVQVGDNVIISAGFSQATFGTYTVIDVTPFWFDVNVGAPNGLPLEAGIITGSSGLVFYSSAKRSVMVAAEDRCSVRVNGDNTDNALLEPKEIGDPSRPAIYFKHGTAYSLVIHNLSLSPLNVVVASAE
jgi:hypothetical protein